MASDIVHVSVNVRLPLLYAVLTSLRLPSSWLLRVRNGPHDPECTPTACVLRAE